MTSSLRNIEFVTTVADIRGLPPADGAEVAFVGRSNAGKSSAINALSQRTRMAFASKTPGRTQHINFFRVAPERYLVDLPGYGYAAVPNSARAHWHELVGGYLRKRSSLCGVIVIMDVRHPLTKLDLQLLDWIAPTGVPAHVLLTKTDKLTRHKADSTLREVVAALAARPSGTTAQLFSSTRKIGIVEATRQIHRWFERWTE